MDVVSLSFMIAPAVTAFASVRYAMRERTRASLGLAIGAVGVLLSYVASRLMQSIVMPRFYSPPWELPPAVLWVNGGLLSLALVFGLLFSLSLLAVLRRATSQADSGTGGLPAQDSESVQEGLPT